jgi:hypothetical protein
MVLYVPDEVGLVQRVDRDQQHVLDPSAVMVTPVVTRIVSRCRRRDTDREGAHRRGSARVLPYTSTHVIALLVRLPTDPKQRPGRERCCDVTRV